MAKRKRRRKGRGRRPNRWKVNETERKIVDSFTIKRKTSINFRKACDDLGLPYGVVVDDLLSGFVLDIYRDKINRMQ